MDTQYNSKCFIFEKNTFSHGILDSCVDATYIIHLKDNGRLDHILEQLKEYRPTSTVYIAHNKGFKKCDKKLIEQASYQDLTDAFLQCFKHADSQGYNNILILEDDFIFSPDIKNSEHINSICQFVSSKQQDEFIYYLGCVPVLIILNSFGSHYSSIKSLTTHAIIYSKKARSKITDFSDKHWDVIVEKNIGSRYLYYKPLCYQLFPETENKKEWADKDNGAITWIKNAFIKGLSLDKEAEWGFFIIYVLAKLILALLIILIIFIIYLVWYKVLRKNKIFRKYI
jgi:hypothetical protein